MTDGPWKLKFYFLHFTKLPLRRPITQKQDEIGLFWWQILKAWVLITYYTNFQAHKSFHSQDIGIQTWLFINMHDSQGSKMGIPLCLEEPQHENDLEFWQNILHMFIIYVKVPLQIFLAKSESVRWGPLVEFIWNDPIVSATLPLSLSYFRAHLVNVGHCPIVGLDGLSRVLLPSLVQLVCWVWVFLTPTVNLGHCHQTVWWKASVSSPRGQMSW